MEPLLAGQKVAKRTTCDGARALLMDLQVWLLRKKMWGAVAACSGKSDPATAGTGSSSYLLTLAPAAARELSHREVKFSLHLHHMPPCRVKR